MRACGRQARHHQLVDLLLRQGEGIVGFGFGGVFAQALDQFLLLDAALHQTVLDKPDGGILRHGFLNKR